MTPDMINGLFELVGSIFLLFNVFQMMKDKELKGTSITPVIFFTSWGFWNLYFYPSVGAYWSFLGGICVVCVNTLWMCLTFYYMRKRKNELPTGTLPERVSGLAGLRDPETISS